MGGILKIILCAVLCFFCLPVGLIVLGFCVCGSLLPHKKDKS